MARRQKGFFLAVIRSQTDRSVSQVELPVSSCYTSVAESHNDRGYAPQIDATVLSWVAFLCMATEIDCWHWPHVLCLIYTAWGVS